MGMTIRFYFRTGVQQVLNFTSVDLVSLAAGYPRLRIESGNYEYELSMF